MYVLDAVKMRQADEFTIEKVGIAQEVLMERAALAVTDCVVKYNPHRVLCVCGNGNNGADALAVARILKMRGVLADVFLCSTSSEQKLSLKKQYDIFAKVGGKTVTDTDFTEYDIIVDGILGIGIDRKTEGHYAEVIEAINHAGKTKAKIISVDIPSGIHTDKGTVLGCAVKADETVTFAYHKPGHLLYPGAEYCGNITVADIGISHSFTGVVPNVFTCNVEHEFYLPKRECDGNKGTFGRVLIIAGSKEMYGACYLAALAALRSGVGLVDVYTHAVNGPALQTMLPEAIVHLYDENFNQDELIALMKKASCVVIGPGISINKTAARIVEVVLQTCEKNIVADADALNCIAQNKELLYNQKKFPHRALIMTPHPGEFSRLTGKTVSELKEDYVTNVRDFATEFSVIVVGKGAGSVVSDGTTVYINRTGNDGMATAGSGDVLAGIIGGLCAQGEKPFDASWKGVCLHGMAGDYAIHNGNAYSLMASDIAHALQHVMKTSFKE